MTDKRPQSEKKRSNKHAKRNVPARFKLIYESQDGKLCLFEDVHGHLTAVRSVRLV